MSFFGKDPDPTSSTPAGLRSWEYKRLDGSQGAGAASYVSFMPDHVTFWIEHEDDGDDLVLAETNTNVTRLKQVAK